MEQVEKIVKAKQSEARAVEEVCEQCVSITENHSDSILNQKSDSRSVCASSP